MIPLNGGCTDNPHASKRIEDIINLFDINSPIKWKPVSGFAGQISLLVFVGWDKDFKMG